MMLCEEVRKLAEEYVAGSLDEVRRQAVARHLRSCPECHRAVEEARLAGLVLRKASRLPAPPQALAANIKSAIRTRMVHKPRPIHERALGSPAFMATCASLVCGAIICLAAIWRVAAVPAGGAPVTDVVAQAAPVTVQSLVTVQPRPAPVRAVPAVRLVGAAGPRPAPARAVATHRRTVRAVAAADWRPPPRPGTAARVAVRPREARAARGGLMTVRPATHELTDEFVPVSFRRPLVQRTSLPGSLERVPAALTEPVHPPAGHVDDLPAALDTRTPATEALRDER